jgi:PAS domain S-box-containing protein
MPKSRKKTSGKKTRGSDELSELRSKVDRLDKTLSDVKDSLADTQTEFDRSLAMLEDLPGGVCLVDAKGRLTFANNALGDMLGTTADKAVNKRFLDLVSPDDLPRVKKELGAAGGRLPARVEFTISRRKGPELAVQVVSTPLYGRKKTFLGSLALVTNVSERRAFVRKLQSLAGLNTTILLHAPLGIITVDHAGFVTSENEAMRTAFCGGKTWIGFNAYEIPTLRSAGVDEALREAFKGESVSLANVRFRSFDDEEPRVVDLELVPVQEAKKKVELVVLFFEDRTEASHADEMRQMLAAIIENTSDAVISVDLDGKFRAWNPGAELMYGYTADEILGQIRDKLLQGEIIYRPNALRHRKDGTPITVSIVLAPIRDESGEIIGTSGIHRDVSEHARWEKTLEAKNLELEEVNRKLRMLDEMKETFLATISHELRSPLVSARGYVDLLRSGEMGQINDDAKAGLDVANKNINHLIKLIDDLLTLSSLTAKDDDTLVRNRFVISEMAEITAAQTRLAKPKKRIEIKFDIPDDLPRGFGNEKLYERVFTALLSNAEKFSEPAAFIKVSARQRDDGWIEVAVFDRGAGIRKEHLERIFERFYQADASRARAFGGAGLGLALAKTVVDIHGGEISVESEVGEGTTISFTIPAE